MIKWHKKGTREASGRFYLNCLYQHSNVFIMDNHKAAIWSWYQFINQKQKYNYLHIDRHYDLFDSQQDLWIDSISKSFNGDLSKSTLADFESLNYISDGHMFPVFQYDNFFPIAEALHPDLFENLVFLTHKDGTLPPKYSIQEKCIAHSGGNLEYWIESNTNGNKWIIDIDIDFFFCDDEVEDIHSFLSKEFASLLAKQIASHKDKIEVLTIALSPEFCPDWDTSIEYANIFCNEFGFNFQY